MPRLDKPLPENFDCSDSDSVLSSVLSKVRNGEISHAGIDH